MESIPRLRATACHISAGQSVSRGSASRFSSESTAVAEDAGADSPSNHSDTARGARYESSRRWKAAADSGASASVLTARPERGREPSIPTGGRRAEDRPGQRSRTRPREARRRVPRRRHGPQSSDARSSKSWCARTNSTRGAPGRSRPRDSAWTATRPWAVTSIGASNAGKSCAGGLRCDRDAPCIDQDSSVDRGPELGHDASMLRMKAAAKSGRQRCFGRSHLRRTRCRPFPDAQGHRGCRVRRFAPVRGD